MRIATRSKENVVILDLEGRLVAGDGDLDLRTKLEELFDGAADAILVNFEQVRRMDSSGIGELVAGWKRGRKLGVRVAILRPGDRVRHTLHLSQILPLLEVYEDEDEAVAALRGTG
ncbi:MAG: STAS domain-containing protein [Acidobacteria bacterium]|nr:STAS domain-containing protein [Acidobacteriota bacterium]